MYAFIWKGKSDSPGSLSLLMPSRSLHSGSIVEGQDSLGAWNKLKSQLKASVKQMRLCHAYHRVEEAGRRKKCDGWCAVMRLRNGCRQKARCYGALSEM